MKDNPYIKVSTLPNGYELKVDDHEYYYHSFIRLVVGAIWHIRYNFTEHCDIDQLIDVMCNKKRVREIVAVRDRINADRATIVRIRKRNNELKAEIAELKKEIKTLKKVVS